MVASTMQLATPNTIVGRLSRQKQGGGGNSTGAQVARKKASERRRGGSSNYGVSGSSSRAPVARKNSYKSSASDRQKAIERNKRGPRGGPIDMPGPSKEPVNA